ncbi:N-myc-interactor isoform X1 [Podarcis raffonei]|uniref:N-myc-interactor isoform X1 n=2 Tax=Podarcis raffonei TaxID=65483 RepID=UPI00232937DA|nr:N-myc-interactor isoform X1 [Podarcis raffonei]
MQSSAPNMEESEITGALVNETENVKEPDKLKSMENGEPPGTLGNKTKHLGEQEKDKTTEEGQVEDQRVTEAERERQEWEEKVAKAEKEKAETLLSKLAADEKRSRCQEEFTKLKDQENEALRERMMVLEKHQEELSLINSKNTELKREIQVLKDRLAEEKAKCGEVAQRYRLKNDIPEKKMKFMRLENIKDENMYMNITCLFHIATKIPFRLSQGEALITFEEECVAQGLIQKHCHNVNFESKMIAMKALPVILERGVTFELHAKISRKQINVSNIPHLNIPPEWMRDKLELNLYKAKLGGEVQNVTYDQQSQMALVTFGQPIAANNIVRYGKCPFRTGERTHFVLVSPIIEKTLNRFQIFSGISRRTILLTGIKAEEDDDDESVQDMIAIHFQKPRNGGGEVENVKFVSQGAKVAYFENDAENVI